MCTSWILGISTYWNTNSRPLVSKRKKQKHLSFHPLFLLFFSQIYSSEWFDTHYIPRVALNHSNTTAVATWGLELQVCTNIPNLILIFLTEICINSCKETGNVKTSYFNVVCNKYKKIVKLFHILIPTLNLQNWTGLDLQHHLTGIIFNCKWSVATQW